MLKKKPILSVLGCLLFVAIIYVFLHFRPTKPVEPVDPFVSMVHSFWTTEVIQKLEKAGFKGAQASKYERTTDGNGLLISGYRSGEPGSAVWIVKNGTVRCVRSHGNIAYADEDGRLIAWSNPSNVYFADGSRLSVGGGLENTSLSVDVSGKYFAVVKGRGGSWLGRVGHTHDVVWSSDDFSSYWLRCVGNKIFLWETGSQINPACLILVDDGSKIQLEKKIELNGYAGRILDVDPSGEALLVQRGDPGLSSFYVYTIQSDKWTRFYPPSGEVVFLHEDPFAHGLVAVNDGGQTNQATITDNTNRMIPQK
jgi:hypothetical protein